jgi:precorrin-6A/cobalt-precorrin-6A reductase
MADRPRVLILGGTAEAVALANQAAAAFDIVYSLAGRTRGPSLPTGVGVRTGGFGGADALAVWIDENRIDAVVDATHPFARLIAGNAARACNTAGKPHLKLLRAAWVKQTGDNWRPAAKLTVAAKMLPQLGKSAFLSIGRQELSAFAAVENVKFIVRSIDPPAEEGILPGAEFIIGRGPFTIAMETALLQAHRIDVVVSKNAGGEATYAKICAARALALPVVMVERPSPPTGKLVQSVDQASAWLNDTVL